MKKILIFMSVFILISSVSIVSAESLPTVGGDNNTWGDVLNAYLNVSHNATGHLNESVVLSYNILNGTIIDADISDTTNLTLGEKITFTLGEVIDNIVDGWIKVTGGLEVAGGINSTDWSNVSITGSQVSDDGTYLLATGDTATGNYTFDTDLLFLDSTNNKIGIGTMTNLLDIFNINGSIDLRHTSTESDDHALEIDLDAAGFGDVKAIDIVYKTGAISIGQDEEAILVNIDDFLATGGDVIGLEVISTEGGSKIIGLETGVLVNPIEQLSGIFEDMDSVDNNGNNHLSQFISTASDVAIFTNDNDYVTIGNAVKFEEIEFILDTSSSGAGISPTFEFSTGIGSWTEFNPTDGTNGLRNNGVVLWLDSNIPTWTNGTGNEFLIRITRTRNNLGTTPIEDKIQIASATEYFWDKEGFVSILNLSTSSNVTIGENLNVTGLYYGNGSQLTGISGGIWTNVSGVATYTGDANASQDLIVGNDINLTSTSNINLPSTAFYIGSVTGTQGTLSLGIGTSLTIDDGSLAIGRSALTTGTGDSKTAIGNLADATGDQGTAIGYSSRALTGATGVGKDVDALGTNSVAIGRSAYSGLASSIAIGQGARADGGSAVVVGYLADTGASSFPIAIGRESQSQAESSIAIGYLSNASFTESVALGRSATTTEANQFMVGSLTYPLNTTINGYLNVTSLGTATANTVCISETASGVLSTCSSSTRYKENFSQLNATTTIWNKYLQLQPYIFNFKNSSNSHLGLLAEDVYELFPRFVYNVSTPIYNTTRIEYIDNETNQTSYYIEKTLLEYDNRIEGINYRQDLTTANLMMIQDLKNDLELIQSETCGRDPTWSWC